MHERLTRPQTILENFNWQADFSEITALLERHFGLTGVMPVRQDLYGDYCYFTGRDAAGRAVFVKWGGSIDSCAHEYAYNSRMYALNPQNFNQSLFFRYDDEIKCLGLEFLDSDNLEDLLHEGRLSLADKVSVARQLVRIGQSLRQGNCMHRDIKLKNFLYTRDKRLLLVDFQFAVDYEGYAEREAILRDPGSVRHQVFGPGKMLWDDDYSLLKVLEKLGGPDKDDGADPEAAEYREAYAEAHAYFHGNLGQRVLRFPRRNWLLFKRRFFKIISLPLPKRSWRIYVQHLWLK